MNDILEFYSHQSDFTEPKEYGPLLNGLPFDIEELCKITQGLLMHYDVLHLYDRTLLDKEFEDRELRDVWKMISRIFDLDARPLVERRIPQNRLVVNCRDYSILLCSFLRHKGYPARIRCGFSNYFRGPTYKLGFWSDHWVCEYWNIDEHRWVLVDAEIDDLEREYYQVKIDPLDVKRDQFLVAGKAWKLCRTNQSDADCYGIQDMRGRWFIQGNLLRDLAALNKMEMLCWDCWGLADCGPDDFVSSEECTLLDRVANLCQDDNPLFDNIRSIYLNNINLCVPPNVKSFTGKGLKIINFRNMDSPNIIMDYQNNR